MRLPFRQIHLDFHTSGQISGVGSEFDPDEFAETLQAAHVDSVTCFSRCHHGWIYHDTEKFPERRHPHLTCNLLKEQIEACHARGIRVPIYITVLFDLFTARQHPDWLRKDEEGCISRVNPFETGFNNRLCLSTPYVDFVEQQTIEVCETMDVDGIFFDIVAAQDCCCQYCIEAMLDQGLDPADPAQRRQYADWLLLSFQERIFNVVRSRHPDASVFYNSGHAGPKHREMIDSFTHLELESLPSGGWGYMHFPVAQRYARGLDMETLGMTGKFHTSWGDFHSFKNPAALEFECLQMLALGAKCSIGDQLHPRGQIDEETYELIGNVYAHVEAVEPWCEGVVPLADIGVMTPEEFAGDGPFGLPPVAIGACRMLQEAHQQFDIIDSQSDFTGYGLLILPDQIPVGDELRSKLSAYVDDGGSLLASYRSGLDPTGERFNLPELGVTLKGEAPFSPDFILPDQLGEGLRNTGYVMYKQGLEVTPMADAQVLSPMIKPYFNRTWRHFCSHRHTPAEGRADYPGAVRNGNCIYFMHPLFEQYEENAPLWCKQLLINGLKLLLPEPLVRSEAPSSALVALNAQPTHNRLVLHVLHYIPERRGRDFDVIEDVIPIYDMPVSVRVEGQVSTVGLVPQGEGLEFEQAGGRVEFVIPEVAGQQMVELQLI